ncbi:Prostaglandin reductase 2 [Lamellibrachia satsuma]|nr:Prostaglandin reductase 2 [Lamellibrachia satsuma]
MSKINYRVVLQKRPGVDQVPQEDNFRCEECPYPSEDLETGDILIRTCYLSVDPASRCQMNGDTGVDYLQPWTIGETIVGLSGVGMIVKSAHPSYSAGDIIYSFLRWPWTLYFARKAADITGFQKVDLTSFGGRISRVLHMGVGLTALIGIQQKGHVTAGANQTCVVSGAAGACGSIAGQVARLEGCQNVVGICGSQEKCDWLMTDLHFTSAINYKTDDIDKKLTELCPSGIDVYFDNVGGDISDSVIKQMNKNSHVVLCGQISQYNKDVPYPPPLTELTQQKLEENNITRERFLVLNYPNEFETATRQLLEWIHSSKLKIRETVTQGLENSGRAFVSLMKGGNIGKQLVHVSDP